MPSGGRRVSARVSYGDRQCGGPGCSETFTAYRSWQLYCSQRCRIAAWKAQHQGKGEMLPVAPARRQVVVTLSDEAYTAWSHIAGPGRSVGEVLEMMLEEGFRTGTILAARLATDPDAVRQRPDLTPLERYVGGIGDRVMQRLGGGAQ